MDLAEGPRLFVYGTLRPGGALHAGIAPFVVAAYPADVAGAILALPAGYPALVPARGGRVVGDVLVLAGEEGLRAADRIEGCPVGRPGRTGVCGYRRVPRRVSLRPGGTRLVAWCYDVAPEERARVRGEGRLVPGGDWLASAVRPPREGIE